MAMSARVTNANGRIVAEKRNGQRRYHQHDALGNTIALINDAGTVTNAFDYWPYGEIRTPVFGLPTPFLYCGQWGYYTDTTGRIYVRARTYRPVFTRWWTVDPLWPREQSYEYCWGNPTRWVDPFGSDPCEDRTKKYCQHAKDLAHQNWGINCFCFVSGNMCKFIKIPDHLCAVLGFEMCSFLKQCQSWISCINKCLFDCYLNGTGCSPQAKDCWDKANSVGFPDPWGPGAAPCTKVLCLVGGGVIPGDPREDCCKSMVACEQTQLTHCVKSKVPGVPGPCAGLDRDNACCKAMEEASAILGMPFPFCGTQADRIGAASQNCCKQKVWKGIVR